VARARGLVAVAKKDFKVAVEHFSKCTDELDACELSLAEAQEKAGDAAAASKTRATLLAANHRDSGWWLVRGKLGAPAKK